VNAQILIHTVVQQTTVFLAQLATSGGVRAPLTRVANQVFLELTEELYAQGVKKSVIADMFGMTLRTYHRKVRELSQSESFAGRSVWEALLDTIRERQPIIAAELFRRFARDDRDVVASVLTDLVNSGLCYRSGRGVGAVYRIADAADFGADSEQTRAVANEYLIWQAVYRASRIQFQDLVGFVHLPEQVVREALASLLDDGRVEAVDGAPDTYVSRRIDVPVGQAEGWEAAVFDHFQAMISALCAKLAQGSGRSDRKDLTGGATYTLDLWPGHPLETEALGTLQRVRAQLEELRGRLDEINTRANRAPDERLVFYFGQHFKTDRDTE
jgi:hypothetical protein